MKIVFVELRLVKTQKLQNSVQGRNECRVCNTGGLPIPSCHPTCPSKEYHLHRIHLEIQIFECHFKTLLDISDTSVTRMELFYRE